MLPGFWFGKRILVYQIRSYRYLIDMPNFTYTEMKVIRNGFRVALSEQLAAESRLWGGAWTNKIFDLHRSLESGGYTVQKYNPEDILENIKRFLKHEEQVIDGFWELWHQYNDGIMKQLGRPLPFDHRSRMLACP